MNFSIENRIDFLKGPIEAIGKVVNEEKNCPKLFFLDTQCDFKYSDLYKRILQKTTLFNLNENSHKKVLIDDSSAFELIASLLASFYSPVRLYIISSLTPSELKKKYLLTHQFHDANKVHQQESLLNLDKLIFNEHHSFFLLSSGSSNEAKWIELSYQNIFLSAHSTINRFQYSSQELSLLNLPLNHIGGLMVFFRALFSLSTVIDLKRFQAKRDIYQPSILSLVPLQLEQIIDEKHAFLTRELLQKCKVVFIGGGLLTQELKNNALNFALPIVETYGMTETSSMILIDGKPLPHAQIKLGEKNRIYIKSKSLSPSVTSTLDSEGYYPTNDEGEIIKIGNEEKIIFKRRLDLLIKSGGELIDPLALEEAIKKIFPNNVLFISSLPHYKWGETLILIIDKRSSLSLLDDQNILLELKKHFHPFHIPKIILRKELSQFFSGIKLKRFQLKKIIIEELLEDIFQIEFMPQKNEIKSSTKLVIISHGFMEDKEDWRDIINPLLSHLNNSNVTFMLFNHAGHGKNQNAFFNFFSSREDYYFYFAYYFNFLTSSFEYFDFIGYSMGGRFLIDLIPLLDSKTLSKIQNITLISSSFGYKKYEHNEKKMRLDSDLSLFTNVSDHRSFFLKWYQQPLFNDYDKHPQFQIDLERKKSYLFSKWQQSLQLFSQGISINYFEDNILFFRQHLSENKNSQLNLIIGKKDQKYLLHAKELGLHLKKILKLHIIDHAAHNLHKTHKEQLIGIILELLEKR